MCTSTEGERRRSESGIEVLRLADGVVSSVHIGKEDVLRGVVVV